MDYIKKLIRDWMDLTDHEIAGVMQCIDEHRVAVEAEYQQVLREAEEERRYWEERNCQRFAEIGAAPPRTDHPEARAKLADAKAKRQRS